MAELEHQARRMKSPRSYIMHVRDLRSGQEVTSEASANPPPPPSVDSLMQTLQVQRLNVPLPRQRSLPLLLCDYGGHDLHSILKQPSDASGFLDYALHDPEEPPPSFLPETDKSVTFSNPPVAHPSLPPPRRKPPSVPAQLNGSVQRPGSLELLRQMTAPRNGSQQSSLASSRSSVSDSRPVTRGVTEVNLARTGRPIPQVAQIPDPTELALAVQTQREASAAVDIQRIFRGYVARSVYKQLLSDERRKMEDKQRAAVQIQRAYRGHLSRKQAIGRRPPDPEMLHWARNYRSELIEREQERHAKAQHRAAELASNQHQAQSKLSVIGPHVNIYKIYHPERTGPSRQELNRAACIIQKLVRGWLVRRRFYKLHRKAAWYGSTFSQMVQDYKSAVRRVQRQHGVDQPQTPFSTADMNHYIDTRRRYESVFEKKAYAGELERSDLESFFKECDLYPSQAEIEKAIRVTLKGRSARHKGGGLDRRQMLDVVFYIYTPPAANLRHTRRSTWMNPIIDGVEAKSLIGSEFVEPAPLEPCINLVFAMKRRQREEERAAAETAELSKGASSPQEQRAAAETLDLMEGASLPQEGNVAETTELMEGVSLPEEQRAGTETAELREEASSPDNIARNQPLAKHSEDL